jgi:hypothetical protein
MKEKSGGLGEVKRKEMGEGDEMCGLRVKNERKKWGTRRSKKKRNGGGGRNVWSES